MPFRKEITLWRKRRRGDSQHPVTSALRRRSIPPLAAVLVSIALLLVFNFANWRFLRLLEVSKERDLLERLRTTARMTVYELKKETPFILSLIYDRDPEEEAFSLYNFAGTESFRNLVARLEMLRQYGDLSEVVLISNNGNVIADSSGRYRAGEEYRFWDLDAIQIRESRVMEAATRRYWAEGEPYQRLYRRLSDEDRTLAIIQISISAVYLQEMVTVRNQVFRQWLVTSALLLLIGFWIYRLFQYVLSLEKSAMQGLRVESMGALAGGVAHELRNPLAIMRALAEEIRAEHPDGTRIGQNSADIISEIDRVNDLVTQFLSLSRPPEATPAEPADLAEEITRVVELMKKGTPGEITFRIQVPDRPVYVAAGAKTVRQLLLNVLINAREALPAGGGTVAVELRERRGTAELHVIDTGIGIATADLERIFEPFYTTKRMGTGLGLPISRSIIENLDGTIKLASTPGKGTTCTIILPLAGGGKPAQV